MDTIANMLSQVMNAAAVRKETVEVPYSRMNEAIAKVLHAHNYVGEVRTFKEKESSFKKLSIGLRYDEQTGAPAITRLRRVSTPGQRIYRGKHELREVYDGLGISVVSTSRGLMTGREAKARDLGGEIVCEVW